MMLTSNISEIKQQSKIQFEMKIRFECRNNNYMFWLSLKNIPKLILNLLLKNFSIKSFLSNKFVFIVGENNGGLNCVLK